MIKKNISALLSAAMLLSTVQIPVLAENGGESFTDVPQGHWAYDNIITLANEGVINGVGDGLFKPEDALTRAQLTKLLICAVDRYDNSLTTDNFIDVADDSWYMSYIASAVASGMYGSDYEPVFLPDGVITRGTCAKWIVNTLGTDSDKNYTYSDIKDSETGKAVSTATAIGVFEGYEDGTFKPDNGLSRAEASAVIMRVMNYNNERSAVRADAANEIVLADDVTAAESSETVNVPISAKTGEITFKNADETLKNLKKGDILYMPPSQNFETGFLGKVVSVSKGTNTTIRIEQPKLEEVIKSIDISAYFNIDESMVGDGGDLQLAKSGKSSLPVGGVGALRLWDSVSSADNGFKIENPNTDGGIEVSLWDKTVGAYANANAKSVLHYQTPSYEKKDGLYAAIDMSLEALVDLTMEVDKDGLSDLSVKTAINTDIASTAGFAKSGEKSKSYDLPDVDVPIAGVLNVNIQPKLVISAEGSMVIETNASLKNSLGMQYTLDDGLEAYNTTMAAADLSVNAEGKIKAGPQVTFDLSLCKCEVLGVEIMDGYSVVEANAALGVGVYGKLEKKDGITITENSVKKDSDEEEERHSCYFCVQGTIFCYADADIGIGSDLQKLYSELSGSGKELKKTVTDEELKLKDWHLSTGDGYTNEFEFEKCPHIEYRVDISVKDKESDETISAATIKAVNNDEKEFAFSETSDSSYYTYLPNGGYKVTAVCEDYKDAEFILLITDKPTKLSVKMEGELNYIKIYSEFLAKTNFNKKKISYYDFYDIKNGNLTESTTTLGSFEDAYVFDCDNDDIPELIAAVSGKWSYPYRIYMVYRYEDKTVNNVYNLFGSGGGSGTHSGLDFTKAPDGTVYLRYDEFYHGSMSEKQNLGYMWCEGRITLMKVENNIPGQISSYGYDYKIDMNSNEYDSKINGAAMDYKQYYNSYFGGYVDYEFGEAKGANLDKYYTEG